MSFDTDRWKIAPGHCLVYLDDPEDGFGVFDLPDEKALYTGKVEKVGPHSNHWLRLFRVPQFIKPGRRVMVRNIKQRMSTNVVIVETATLLCMLD